MMKIMMKEIWLLMKELIVTLSLSLALSSIFVSSLTGIFSLMISGRYEMRAILSYFRFQIYIERSERESQERESERVREPSMVCYEADDRSDW